MPTTKPRVNVVLEESLYGDVKRLANQRGVSLSLEIRDLVREAVEFYEDHALAQWAARRMKTFRSRDGLSHEEVWKGLLPKKK